jgi:purine-binding chemotaxis protein CheW
MSASDATSTNVADAAEMPWVLARVGDGLFALTTTEVREMVSTPRVTAVPEAPPHVRGIINLRGTVMPLVDLRRRFGKHSRLEEAEALVDLLKQREQDHRNWVDALEKSVEEKTRFALTTDPHVCKFGVWYDTFTTEDLILSTAMRRFDEPHKRIHAVGAEVIALCERGDYESARERVAVARRGLLNRLIDTFAETYVLLRDQSREITVVLNDGRRTFGVAVDSIQSVERLPASGVSPVSDVGGGLTQEFVTAIGRRGKDNSLVMILDGRRLM